MDHRFEYLIQNNADVPNNAHPHGTFPGLPPPTLYGPSNCIVEVDRTKWLTRHDGYVRDPILERYSSIGPTLVKRIGVPEGRFYKRYRNGKEVSDDESENQDDNDYSSDEFNFDEESDELQLESKNLEQSKTFADSCTQTVEEIKKFSVSRRRRRNTSPKISEFKNSETQTDQLPENQNLDFIRGVNSEGRRSLSDCLGKLLVDGDFSDLTIQCDGRIFNVHKNILCSRSPVFSAMFTSNMKEKSNKNIEILDVEDDILERLLLFMYTDVIGKLDVDGASKLYTAADKYDVITLKNACRSYLKSNLSKKIVSGVLELADMHQDESLKKSVQNYIMKNEVEVFRSDEWKSFMQTNGPLALETMYLKFAK